METKVNVAVSITLPNGRMWLDYVSLMVDQPVYPEVNKLAETMVLKLHRIKIGTEDLDDGEVWT